MSLQTPESVRKLQAALHAKAKELPDYRFYSLYDKVCREDVLRFAYRHCRHNGGSAGADGETFEDIELSGVEPWLGGLAEVMPGEGYASGCVASRKCKVGVPHATHSMTVTCSLASSSCKGDGATFRGRTRDSLSGSRMR